MTTKEKDRNEDGSIKKGSELGKLISELVDARKKFEEEHGELEVLEVGDIKFPSEVSKILVRGFGNEPPRPDTGAVVRIRPVGDEKTYAGIFLSDLPRTVMVARGSKSKALFVSGHRNPAIFIPELKRVVWGDSSWWAKVEDEKDFERLITDADIADVWYVKLLKEMNEGRGRKGEEILCPDCGGIDSRRSVRPCERCEGTGRVRWVEDEFAFIVELEAGVWLTTGDGDPPRTLVRKNAEVFGSREAAKYALGVARVLRPFKDARIIDIVEEPEDECPECLGTGEEFQGNGAVTDCERCNGTGKI